VGLRELTKHSLLNQLPIDDGVYSFAVSPKEEKIAVGTRGMVGLYQVNSQHGVSYLKHVASFSSSEAPGEELAFVDLIFSADGLILTAVREDGSRVRLAVDTTVGGLMEEVKDSPANLVASYQGQELRYSTVLPSAVKVPSV
jgi:hypothetical protein